MTLAEAEEGVLGAIFAWLIIMVVAFLGFILVTKSIADVATPTTPSPTLTVTEAG